MLTLARKFIIGLPNYIDYSLHLIIHAAPWENRRSEIKLRKDTPKRPHVDCLCIFDSQKHLRGTIKSRLNVRIDWIVEETRRTEIDNF